MKLKTRLLVLYAFLLVLLFVSFFAQWYFANRGSTAIRQKEVEQHKLLLDRVTELKGRSLEAISIDYTFWDDMVNFVNDGNQTFADENLVTGLKTFNADAIWVYKPNGQQAYATNDIPDTTPNLGVTFTDAILKQLSAKHFLHFFTNTNTNTVLEVRAATIQPTADEARLTPARGYFFVAKAWDPAYLQSLDELSQSSVQLGLPGHTPPTDPSQLAFSENLQDWTGAPIQTIYAHAPSTITKNFSGSELAQFMVLVGFGLLSLGGLILFLTRSVEQPLALVSQSIGEGTPHNVKSLMHQPDEFGQLARLLTAFYEQKLDIAQAEARNKELIKLAHVKDEFVSIASHQLRTPASAVKGYLSLILDKPKGDTSPEFRQYVETAYRENEQQLLIINDLLNVTQIDTGSFRLNKSLADLGQLLQEVIDEQQILISTKFQKLTFKKPKAAVHALIDQEKIRMVLNNLINNASKFTPDRGKIVIGLTTTNESATVTISDTGYGIDKASMHHLFKRFSRANDPQVVQTGGAGLGLYMVKKILDLHNGSIDVSSKPGHGTTFKVTIPFALQ